MMKGGEGRRDLQADCIEQYWPGSGPGLSVGVRGVEAHTPGLGGHQAFIFT